MRSLLPLPLLAACVATQTHGLVDAELSMEIEEGQQEAGFELVLDIREGGMPEPEWYGEDVLTVDVGLRGAIEVDVMLGVEPKPRKGASTKRSHFFQLNDIARDCPVDGACQRVVTVDVRRENTEATELTVFSRFWISATQAAVNTFPNTATEQEIRLRAFER